MTDVKLRRGILAITGGRDRPRDSSIGVGDRNVGVGNCGVSGIGNGADDRRFLRDRRCGEQNQEDQWEKEKQGGKAASNRPPTPGIRGREGIHREASKVVAGRTSDMGRLIA